MVRSRLLPVIVPTFIMDITGARCFWNRRVCRLSPAKCYYHVRVEIPKDEQTCARHSLRAFRDKLSASLRRERERELHLVGALQRHQRWRARHTLSNELNRGKSGDALACFPSDDEFITDGVKRRRRSISSHRLRQRILITAPVIIDTMRKAVRFLFPSLTFFLLFSPFFFSAELFI